MTLTDSKLSVVAFVRALLNGQMPAEEVTKKFLYEYLPHKIKHHLHQLPYYDCHEEANQIYVILSEWLLERSGFIQLSDNDLYEKVKNKIIDYLRSKDPKYARKEIIEVSYNDELHSPLPEEQMTEEEKDPIDQPSLEIFKLKLYEHPELMIEYIQNTCSDDMVGEWLVKFFPTEEAFDFLIMDDKQFLLMKKRNIKKDFFNQVRWQLEHAEVFERACWLDEAGRELEFAKIVKERGAGTTAQNIRKNFINEFDRRMKKYGYFRLSNKIRLKETLERDKDLKEIFDRFVPQFFLKQKS